MPGTPMGETLQQHTNTRPVQKSCACCVPARYAPTPELKCAGLRHHMLRLMSCRDWTAPHTGLSTLLMVAGELTGSIWEGCFGQELLPLLDGCVYGRAVDLGGANRPCAAALCQASASGAPALRGGCSTWKTASERGGKHSVMFKKLQ